MIRVLKTIEETKAFQQKARAEGKTIGFVPTMGALHDGHLTLVRKAKADCEIVIVSIFVNPTQFNDPKDLEKYPRDLDSDLNLLKAVGVDAVFFPQSETVYPDGYRYKLTESDFSRRLCGAHRPGHFDGVLTVVMKLFQIVQPHKAYFGEKDYQQLSLIKDMAKSFFLDLTVIPVPTVRESDGLAMSSRNVRLTASEREKAPLIFQILKNSKTDQEAIQKLHNDGFKIDYVETVNGRRFAAVFLGDVRLIDNVEV